MKFFFLLFLSLPVFAAPAEKPCAADRAKFCPGVKSTDRKATRACYKEHLSEFSAACQAYLNKEDPPAHGEKAGPANRERSKGEPDSQAVPAGDGK